MMLFKDVIKYSNHSKRNNHYMTDSEKPSSKSHEEAVLCGET